MVGVVRRVAVGRARWLAAFTLLLFASSAVPVFADPEAPAEESPVVQEDTPLQDDQEFAKALEEAKREEEERQEDQEEELASPASIQERENSRDAYADFTAAEAQDLLRAAFPEQLKSLNADPARVLSELEVEKTLGTYGARVTEEDGTTALVESPIPIESELPGDSEEQIDLSLEDVGSGFEPEAGFSTTASFCRDRLTWNFGNEFEDMPPIRRLPPSGRLSFTDQPIRVRQRPELPVLSFAANREIGVAFDVSGSGGRPLKLDWSITARLIRIDSHGRKKAIAATKRLDVATVKARALDQTSISFRIPVDIKSKPGFYRFDLGFERQNGGGLARYSQYLRIVRAELSPRLLLSASVIHPGEVLSFRILNSSSRRISYNVPFAIESFDGSTWKNTGLVGPYWPRIGPSALVPGDAGKCQSFESSTDIAPGLYRVSKNLRAGDGRLTAEFSVQP